MQTMQINQVPSTLFPMPGAVIAIEDIDENIGRLLWGQGKALVVRGTHPSDFLKDVSIAIGFDARSWAWRVCGSDFAVDGAGSYRFADEAESNEKIAAYVVDLQVKGLTVTVSVV